MHIKVCVYIYIHIHTYTHIYTYIYIHIHIAYTTPLIYIYVIVKTKKLCFIALKKVVGSAMVMNWSFLRSYFIFMELNSNFSVVGSQGLNLP